MVLLTSISVLLGKGVVREYKLVQNLPHMSPEIFKENQSRHELVLRYP